MVKNEQCFVAVQHSVLRVNLDEMLLMTAKEVVGFGNCFWERTG